MNIVQPKVGQGKGMRGNRLDFIDFSLPIIKKSGNCLPHWDQSGKLLYVTARLNDSLPASKIAYIQDLKSKIASDNFILKLDNPEECIKKLDYWLNRGYGDCWLKYDKIQKIAEDALNFYDNQKYDLFDYVIMPNHIHFIIMPYEEMYKIWGAYKRYTTRKINEILNRRGELWQKECFNRFIRSGAEMVRIIEYIKNNPESLNWDKGWY